MPHSGSTMFSLFLGTHSRMVGLGGIDRAVQVLAEAFGDAKKTAKLQCTCGAPGVECPFWGEVARALPQHDVRERRGRYAAALDVFTRVFGEEAWPVDSSKHVEPLAEVRTIEGVELRAVHVMKDVRSQTVSDIDRARRDRGIRRPGLVLAVEYFFRWRRENRKIERFLSEQGVRSIRVGYEEACLAPEVIMGAMSDFLGLPREAGSLQLRESRSHLIVGNRMRTQEEKQTLRYDHRWFARRDWLPAAILFPQILRYNSRAVYANGSEAMWKR
jgi:hypothetical protein